MAKMDGYERILSKQKYLAGDVRCVASRAEALESNLYLQNFTLADLFHLPYGNMVSQLAPEVLESKPHVKKLVLWTNALVNNWC
jgi:glutathione S-transferase